MNSKTLAIVAIVLWLAGAGFAAKLFVFGQTETSADGRQMILLTQEERTLVLGEMRQMLETVQEIVSATAAKDMDRVAAAALARGTGEENKVPKSVMMKTPLAFKKLGIATHEGFDRIAAAAAAGGDILPLLDQQLSYCISCHEGYRLQAE